MDILYRASAGTMESSDAYVEIEPAEKGIQIELESVVQAQFGDAIRALYDLQQEKGFDDDYMPPSKIVVFIDELNKYASKDIRCL